VYHHVFQLLMALLFQSSSEFKTKMKHVWRLQSRIFQSSSEFKYNCSRICIIFIKKAFNPLLSLRAKSKIAGQEKKDFQSSSEFKQWNWGLDRMFRIRSFNPLLSLSSEKLTTDKASYSILSILFWV